MNTPYGPNNSHPLSRMKTELVWEGKYDEYGNRRPIRLPDIPLPLQKIETVDEPRDRANAEAARTGDLFDQEAFTKSSHCDDFRNMLIWGDNKLALSALLEQFRGKVDLIYIDPPFDLGADFTMEVQIGEVRGAIQKEQSVLEAVAYRDTWGKGTDSYLNMMHERVMLARELLSAEGFALVHVGDKVASLIEMMLSDVMGADNYRNKIIVRRGVKNVQSQFEMVKGLTLGNDYILLFSKSPLTKMRKLTLPGSESQPGKWDTFWRGTDRHTMRYELFGVNPSTGQWRWKRERALNAAMNYETFIESRMEDIDEYYMKHLEEEVDLDFIRKGPEGQVQYFVPPRDYKLASNVWLDLRASGSNCNYATEKHEELLYIPIEWLTDAGDLVMDFFCGSGTTCAVAEKLGRRWIGVDLGRYAIHTSRKRLIQIQREMNAKGQPYRSFDVYNLGRYERQWWQIDRLKGADEEHRKIVLRFYDAIPLTNSANPLLHGTRSGAFIHVDEIDTILIYEELAEVAHAAQSVGAHQVHCLAWEFEMDLARKKQALEAETGIKIVLKQIPREIMEANRNKVQFFEAGWVLAEAIINEGKVNVALKDFHPALAEAPEKELEALRERAVSSPFDFIDFWAVDFEHRDDKPFEHHWQDFRTRKDRKLKTVSDLDWKYSSHGKKQICVKVIDVFGVDTTTVIEVLV